MNKLIGLIGGLLVVLFGIEELNVIVLLHYHPLEFYYTIQGLWLVLAVVSCETLVLVPIVDKYLNGPVSKAWTELRQEKERC